MLSYTVPGQMVTDERLVTLATQLRDVSVSVTPVTNALLGETAEYGERGISVVLRSEPKLAVFYAVSPGFTKLIPQRVVRDEAIPNADALLSALERAMLRAGFTACST